MMWCGCDGVRVWCGCDGVKEVWCGCDGARELRCGYDNVVVRCGCDGGSVVMRLRWCEGGAMVFNRNMIA